MKPLEHTVRVVAVVEKTEPVKPVRVVVVVEKTEPVVIQARVSYEGAVDHVVATAVSEAPGGNSVGPISAAGAAKKARSIIGRSPLAERSNVHIVGTR